MLKINWSPVRVDKEQRVVQWNAPTTLVVDGQSFDLSLMEDGDIVEHEVLLQASRTGNDYEVTLMLPHGANAPESTRFPVPSMVSVYGNVDVPVYSSPAE